VLFLIFLAVYAGFGFASNVVLIGALFALYGLYQGIFRSVGKAFGRISSPRGCARAALAGTRQSSAFRDSSRA